MTATPPQQKPTLWEDILMLGSDLTGERSGPPPRLAVEGRSSGHGPMLPISDVDKVKPMLLPHGGWPMAAGPASRLGSIEPGDKTGLRLSPHLAPSTGVSCAPGADLSVILRYCNGCLTTPGGSLSSDERKAPGVVRCVGSTVSLRGVVPTVTRLSQRD